jgi:hypothetical protein
VAEPDYEAGTVEAAVKLLNENHQYALGDALAAVASRLAAASARSAGAGGGGSAGSDSASPSTPSKRQRQGSGGSGAGGSGAGPMDVDGAAGGGASGAGGLLEAAGGGSEAAIDALVASWKLPGPGTYEEAEGPYQEALAGESVGVFEAGVPGAYNSHFTAIAGQAEGECEGAGGGGGRPGGAREALPALCSGRAAPPPPGSRSLA